MKIHPRRVRPYGSQHNIPGLRLRSMTVQNVRVIDVLSMTAHFELWSFKALSHRYKGQRSRVTERVVCFAYSLCCRYCLADMAFYDNISKGESLGNVAVLRTRLWSVTAAIPMSTTENSWNIAARLVLASKLLGEGGLSDIFGIVEPTTVTTDADGRSSSLLRQERASIGYTTRFRSVSKNRLDQH